MPDSKILIVDDSKVDRMMLNRAITKTNHQHVLKEASNAVEAIEMIQQEPFDAVFLDINLPGENGFSVLRSLRADQDSSWPLVFVISSSTHPDDVNEAYSSRATAYLSKPCSVAELSEMTKSCLRLIQESVCLTSTAPQRLH